MKLFVSLIDRYAAILLLAILALTVAMVPGLRRITIVQDAAENSFTTPNEMIRSVWDLKKAFGANTRPVAVAIEARGNIRVTDARALQLIANVTKAFRSSPLIRRETVISLSGVNDFANTPEGLAGIPLIGKLPASEQEQSELEHKLAQNHFIYGTLISKDFKTALVVGSVSDAPTLEEIHNQISQAIEPFRNQVPGVSVTLTGDPEINYRLHSSIRGDIIAFVSASFLLILLSFYVIFRTWQGVVLPLLAILVGMIWTMGIVGYYGEPITIISATLPVVLVVVGSACSMHVFSNLLKETQAGEAFRPALVRALRHVLSPLSMSTMTTFIGGISLMAFKIRPIQHFGLFTAVGTLISLAVALVVIPAFFKVLRKPLHRLERSVSSGLSTARSVATVSIHKVPVAGPMTGAIAETVSESIKGGVRGFWQGAQTTQILGRTLRGMSMLVEKNPLPVVGTALAVLVVSLYHTSHIQIGFDNIGFLPKKDSIRVVTERVRSAFGGLESFEVMVDSRKANGILDPQFMQKVSAFEKAATQLPGVSHSFSVAQLLEKVQSVLNPEAKSPLPETAEATSQYLLLLGMSGGGVSLNNLVTSDNQKLRLLLTISASDTKQIEIIYNELQDLGRETFGGGAGIEIGGSPSVWVALMRYMVWGKVQNMMICMLLILLLVSVVYRSITRGLFTVLTLPLGIFANFGLMGALGIRLDVVTAIITSFAMGIGVEFSIYFLAAVKEAYGETHDMKKAIRKAITGPGKTIFYNALCNIVGFSALLFSRFSAIHTFALLMCFSMAMLLLNSMIVLPAALILFPPEFITGHRKRHNLSERRFNFSMKVAFSSLVILVLTYGIIVVDSKAGEPKAPSVQTLLKKAIQAVHTNNEESTYVMRLTGASGDVSTKKMKLWFKSKSENDAKLLIKFVEPADIRGTGFLTIAEKDKATDQWLYLPALKKSRRVKGGNSDEPFLGSDFSMGDLSVDHDDGLAYAVEGSQKCGSADCWHVVGKPKAGADASSLPYSKKSLLIRKDNYLNVSAEFFNTANQLEKVLTLKGIHQEKGKRWVADEIEMKNVLTNHSTVLAFEKRDDSKNIPDYIFSVNFLEKE